ncbi:MAG TPA: AMP-binding protein [Steroidobacteraceae bacterium]|nr:AMP-binding protein [Steroidobacteraceae bacterium]
MIPTTTSPSQSDPAAWIDRAAREYPQRPFLKTPTGRRISYADLRDRSGQFAAALEQRGVQPGDRVAVRVDKSVDSVLLYCACLRLGAVFVPINVASSPNEVEYFLADSRPGIAIVRPQESAEMQALAARSRVRQLETLGTEGEGTLAQLARDAEAADPAGAALDPGSPAAIVYTSGTTGRSKGAILTRANLASNAAVLAETWRFTVHDVVLHTLPLFHVHGLFVAINTVLASAASIVLLPRFACDLVLQQLPEATVYMGVPTHYTRLLQEAGLNRESTSNMRLFISGSAPLLAETHRAFFQRTGHMILERYGLTETLMNTSNPYEGSRVPGSVGLPLRGTSVRVVAQEGGGAQLDPDTIGALEVRGPNVCGGYWQDAEKTRSEFTADGWFRTGDLGRIDRAGYVYIVGRAKDLVISGGYNVYPKEVESELDALPGVLESAVFGVPHPDFGEGVTAAVVLEPDASLTEQAIIESVRSRLARYKIPKRVLLVDELPRNAMGKVQKNVLRSRHATLYGAPRGVS